MAVACLQVNNGVFHTHEGELQVAGVGGHFQGVEAVAVGDGANLRVVDADAHAGQRLTHVVSHHSRHGAGACSREFACHGDDASLQVVGAVDAVHHIVEHLAHGLVLCLHGHSGEGFGQLGAVDEVQSCLFLHFCKELLHSHLRHVERHGLVLYRLCRH